MHVACQHRSSQVGNFCIEAVADTCLWNAAPFSGLTDAMYCRILKLSQVLGRVYMFNQKGGKRSGVNLERCVPDVADFHQH